MRLLPISGPAFIRAVLIPLLLPFFPHPCEEVPSVLLPCILYPKCCCMYTLILCVVSNIQYPMTCILSRALHIASSTLCPGPCVSCILCPVPSTHVVHCHHDMPRFSVDLQDSFSAPALEAALAQIACPEGPDMMASVTSETEGEVADGVGGERKDSHTWDSLYFARLDGTDCSAPDSLPPSTPRTPVRRQLK